MSPYDEPAVMRRHRRLIITYPLHAPEPADQPALFAERPEPNRDDLTIAQRFAEFHAANPHVYNLLLKMALTDAEQGARRISPKLLVERLRASGLATAPGADEYKINNIYTSHYARLLAAEPGLAGRIPMRKLVAE
jgi:hypothetical protein